MNEKKIILGARIASMILTPFYLPVVGMMAVFLFSYLSTFPWKLKLSIILTVYLFTVYLPTALIRFYRKVKGWTQTQIGLKERRVVPYLISIFCYLICYILMVYLHLPHLITSLLVVALVIQIICAIINIRWKISTHTAGVGGALGGLMAYSFLLSFNPLWWMCLILIIAGVVGTSRIILRQHSLMEVSAGLMLGIVSAFFTIILI